MSRVLIVLPVAGVFLFVVFHIVAAILYPGGNHWNPQSSDYSLQYNYWCDLMQEYAINGSCNPGRWFALSSLIFLALSIVLFWVNSGIIEIESRIPRIIHFLCGVLAVVFLLILPLYHDMASQFSMAFAFLGFAHLIMIFLRKHNPLQALFAFVVLSLLSLNYAIWHSEKGLHLLPLIQKFTFFVACSWMLVTSLKNFKKPG